MRTYWLITATALLTAGWASAAQAQSADEDSWTGVYGGVEGTVSSNRVTTTGDLQVTQISNLFIPGRGLIVVPGTTTQLAASKRKTGFDWGGQLGFALQTGNVVLGVEGDIDGSHQDFAATQSQMLPPTALTPAVTIASERDVRMTRTWSIRARAGYSFGKTLIYATAGYANTRLSVFGTDTFNNPGGAAATCASSPGCPTPNLGPEGPNVTQSSNAFATVGGWRAGAGVDFRLSKHISIGLEYRHTDFGTHDIAFHSSVTTFGTLTRDTNGSAGTLGQVITGSTRIGLRSDVVGVRLNFRL